MSYVLVQYILVHNTQGTGDRVVWVCSIRYCCIGRSDQTPFGVEHTFFFKNRLYDLGSMPELGATGSLGVIVCMG